MFMVIYARICSVRPSVDPLTAGILTKLLALTHQLAAKSLWVPQETGSKLT